jgi:hypothetical protein
VPIVLKYGSLNLLETSGLVQACNGIALPFTNEIAKYEKRSHVKVGGYLPSLTRRRVKHYEDYVDV